MKKVVCRLYTPEIDNKLSIHFLSIVSFCKNPENIRKSEFKEKNTRDEPLITRNVQELRRGDVSEDGVSSQLPPSRSFLYYLLLQVHKRRPLMSKQSPQIDH